MITNETKQNKTEVNETKQAKTKPDMTYDFPLPMDEGCNALMDYIKASYGNRGTAVSVSIIKGAVVVKIDPLK